MEVRPARDGREVDEALVLRERVFCGEQGVSREAEKDGRDADALHLVAVEDARVIGTCRLLFAGGEAFLGRLAVEPAHRRRGIGAALLGEANMRARTAGAARIGLHAQLDVRELYAAAGYVERGEPFVEQGIDHVTMEKALA
jgi:predicted GNAT family N-acyltransferase